MRGLPLLICCLALVGLSATALAAGEEITVEYRDKPPYSFTEAGKPAGFLIDRTVKLFQRAGLDAKYTEVPIRRTLLNLQGNAAAMCSPGLYKVPEREAYAQFSLPIHRDRPHVVLAHADAAAQIRALSRLAQLFADGGLTPGLLEGVSYGQQLDQALATTARPAVRAQLTPIQLARMVGIKRVDYMLIDEEDLAWLRRDPEFTPLGLTRIEFSDMPRGQLRYIACSRRVPPAAMERLNRAIRDLLPEVQQGT
jgi:uncharacterized protein (TIGR02285 family)